MTYFAPGIQASNARQRAPPGTQPHDS